jgi:HEAT repeat protein
MTEPTPSSAEDSSSTPHAVPAAVALAVRFAHLVSQVVSAPGAMMEYRSELRSFQRALKRHTVVLTSTEVELLANGEPCSPSEPEMSAACVLLASRMSVYGVEMLTLLERSAEADLNDLARLLATVPSQSDPAAFFAARASAIDARGIPRTLRARVTEPAIPLVPPPVVPATVAEPEPPVEESEPRADRLTEALEIPVAQEPALATLLKQLEAAEDLTAQRPLLANLAEYADLAFRSGQHVAMLDAIAGLVAIEFMQLERDPSDARRAEFAQPLRRLASPLILRQLAVMRHGRADDPTLVKRLQAVLFRFGTDGVEALLDEYLNATTATARVALLDALRALRRTFDVLYEWVRDPDDTVVREAVSVLGDLGGEPAERLIAETLNHADPRVRRAAVAAIADARNALSLDLLGNALGDESPLVRARAVAALGGRGAAALGRLLPLLNTESDTEVLYAAMHAIGSIGTPEGVQSLIACAQGESANPLKRNAVFRLPACAALVIVRTPQAMAAVGMLREDRDRAVRDGAQRLVAQAVRRPTTGAMRVVTE